MTEEDKDKTMDFLERGEIKTMSKDIARLREEEAKKERQRIVQLKTAEEAEKEREKQERAEKEAEERKLAEEKAVKREKELKILKEAREEKEKVLDKEGLERESIGAARFQQALKETQQKEEEERKKFLARVEDKVIALPKPVFIETPPLLKQLLPAKPSLPQKLWIRVLVSILILSVLAGLSTFWYWFLAVRQAPLPASTPPAKETIIPAALISIETSQFLEVSNLTQVPLGLAQVMVKEYPKGQFVRIIIENTEKKQALGLKEFLGALGATTPEGFLEKLDNDFTLFIYSQEQGNRLGFVAKITDKKEVVASLLNSWEPRMETDLDGFFKLLGKKDPALTNNFKQANYRGADFRYQTFNRQDLGIVYTVFNDYFILTSSWQQMEKTLDKF